MIDSDREKFVVACLDTKKQPVNISVVSIGSVNSVIVHPREVFKCSKEDENITNRLKECGEILGIELVDHIIIGDNDTYFSFKENCMM